MARRNTETVDEYLAELAPVRRDAMTLVRNTSWNACLTAIRKP